VLAINGRAACDGIMCRVEEESDKMTRTPIGLATFCAMLAAGCSVSSANVCEFTVAQQSSQPNLLGTKEVLSRTLVAVQPGSPVLILQVDLNGADAILASSGPAGSYGVQVRNVSDKSLSNIAVAISFLSQREGGTLGSRLDSSLDPGEASWVRGIGNVRVAPADAEQAKILVAVESAIFGSCFYKPAQVMPLGWVPNIRAMTMGLSR
jgi:hypothetical protein